MAEQREPAAPPTAGAPPAPSPTSEMEAVRLELADRLLDLFPALYLTLASIIQGVAFSYLLGVIHDHLDHLTLVFVLQSVTALLLISAVWNLYAFSAFALVWYPSVFDGLIPFALGASEILQVLSTGENMARWLGFAAVSALLAFATLSYAFRRAPLHPRNAGLLSIVMQSKKANLLPLFSSSIALGLWALTEAGILSGSSPLAPTVALLMVTGFLINTALHWHRFVKHVRGDAKNRAGAGERG